MRTNAILRRKMSGSAKSGGWGIDRPILLGIMGCLLLSACASSTALRPPRYDQHAAGTFTVAMEPKSGSVFGMTKTFSGGMIGISKGTMVGAEAVTAYVAVENFSGSLNGRKGSFVLLYRGSMTNGAMNLDVVVAPGSGAEELTGIEGRLAIIIDSGKHSYEMHYSLP